MNSEINKKVVLHNYKERGSMNNLFDGKAGLTMFRIVKSGARSAKTYPIYTMTELKQDLLEPVAASEKTMLSTEEELPVLQGGEIIVSLMNPKAVRVSKEHAGYILSQNFIQLFPKEGVDPDYLIFLINESSVIKKQISDNAQNSRMIEKMSLSTLKNLTFPKLPDMELQKLIGRKYLLEKELRYKKNVRDELKLKLTLEKMRRLADESI